MKTSKQVQEDWPGHYLPNTVVRIVLDYLNQSNQFGRDILLYNYPASLEEGQTYPRPSDQLAAVESTIGNVRTVVFISKN